MQRSPSRGIRQLDASVRASLASRDTAAAGEATESGVVLEQPKVAGRQVAASVVSPVVYAS